MLLARCDALCLDASSSLVSAWRSTCSLLRKEASPCCWLFCGCIHLTTTPSVVAACRLSDSIAVGLLASRSGSAGGGARAALLRPSGARMRYPLRCSLLVGMRENMQTWEGQERAEASTAAAIIDDPPPLSFLSRPLSLFLSLSHHHHHAPTHPPTTTTTTNNNNNSAATLSPRSTRARPTKTAARAWEGSQTRGSGPSTAPSSARPTEAASPTRRGISGTSSSRHPSTTSAS